MEVQIQSPVLDVFNSGLTKIQIKELADGAVNDVLERGSVLQIAESLAAMELFIKEVKDDPRYKNYVREEIQKYPKGFTSKSGAKIECCEVGSSYDFSKCGDVSLELFLQNLEQAERSVKERKEFLKKVPAEGIDVIAPYTGEVLRIYPPSKSSTSSYKVSLSKGF